MKKKASKTDSEGVWDSATGVPGMLRNRKNGRYYSRFQVGGKRTFKALKTDVWSTAKLRHRDTMAKTERQRLKQSRVEKGRGLMGDLLDRHLADYLGNTSYSKSAKTGEKNSIDRLVTHWQKCFGTDIRRMEPAKVTEEKVRRFANYLHGEAQFRIHKTKGQRRGYKPVTVNKTIELLHRVLRIAVATGVVAFVPFELDPVVGGPIRKSESGKKVRLPSSAKILAMFEAMRTIDYELAENQQELRTYVIQRAQESAEFAEFMAYSGARLREAGRFRWEDDLGESILLHGTKTRSSRDREVPKIPAMKGLLIRMRNRRDEKERELKGKAFSVGQCREAMETACAKVGIERLTHHSLRHFFATLCIESGVDIPTVSRWLGHADGGVLAMKTYGHLRVEHSMAAAAKVMMR